MLSSLLSIAIATGFHILKNFEYSLDYKAKHLLHAHTHIRTDYTHPRIYSPDESSMFTSVT